MKKLLFLSFSFLVLFACSSNDDIDSDSMWSSALYDYTSGEYKLVKSEFEYAKFNTDGILFQNKIRNNQEPMVPYIKMATCVNQFESGRPIETKISHGVSIEYEYEGDFLIKESFFDKDNKHTYARFYTYLENKVDSMIQAYYIDGEYIQKQFYKYLYNDNGLLERYISTSNGIHRNYLRYVYNKHGDLTSEYYTNVSDDRYTIGERLEYSISYKYDAENRIIERIRRSEHDYTLTVNFKEQIFYTEDGRIDECYFSTLPENEERPLTKLKYKYWDN